MRVLNVGGGSKDIPIPAKYDGWDHVLLDIADGPDVDIVMDATEMFLRGPEREFDAVLCTHNLEHYYAHQVPRVLAGFKRALKLEGEVHIVVPNLGQLIVDMARNGIELEQELYMSAAGPITPLDVFFGYGREIEESGQPFYAHKTGFTAARLHRVLKSAMFGDIKVVANLPSLELEATAKAPVIVLQREQGEGKG